MPQLCSFGERSGRRNKTTVQGELGRPWQPTPALLHSLSGWGPIHPCPTPGHRLHKLSPEPAAVPSEMDKELLPRWEEEAALHAHCGQPRKQLVWMGPCEDTQL